MITFKQFINEATADLPAGLFAKATPTADSVVAITDRFSELPLVDDLHCTIIYSKTAANNIVLPSIPRASRFGAVGVEVEYYAGHDKEGYIVLQLKSLALEKLNKDFAESGLEATFKEYMPHVTLVSPVPDYSVLEAKVKKINEELKDKPLKLEFYYGGYTILDVEEKK
jgi:hypothetical protein